MFKYYYVLGHKQIEIDSIPSNLCTCINILVHYMSILLVNNQNYYINELA